MFTKKMLHLRWVSSLALQSTCDQPTTDGSQHVLLTKTTFLKGCKEDNVVVLCWCHTGHPTEVYAPSVWHRMCHIWWFKALDHISYKSKISWCNEFKHQPLKSFKTQTMSSNHFTKTAFKDTVGSSTHGRLFRSHSWVILGTAVCT